MEDWRKTIWRVPLIALISGFLWIRVMVRLLMRFAVEKTPDGTVSINETASLLCYGVGLLAVLLIGGLLLLRKLTRRDIFFSATVVVVYQIVLKLLQLATGITTGPGAVVFMYLYAPLQWTAFPGGAMHLLIPGGFTDPYRFLASLLNIFVPYLFVLFGKKAST